MRPNSMRNVEELLAEVATGGELTVDEERLIDRITFEKKGQRFGRYATIQVKPVLSIPTISKDTSFAATTAPPSKPSSQRSPKHVQKGKPVPMAGDLPMGNPITAAGMVSATPQNVS